MVTLVERHDEALRELLPQVRDRLFAAEVLSGLEKIKIPEVNFETAKRMAVAARTAIEDGRLGYAIVAAAKP